MAYKFTVILLRPDWCGDAYERTCVCLVETESYDAKQAAQQAKMELWTQDCERSCGHVDDYHCVAVFSGWQSNHYGD